MSKSNGRVVMTCELPNLGTVVGVKSFEEIIDKTPREDPRKDVPAVTIRELSGTKPEVPEVASKSGDADTGATSANTRKPDGSDTGSDSSADASDDTGGREPSKSASTGERTDEEKAEAMWKIARNYVSSGMTRLARKQLQKLARDYPDTKYGKKARKMLGD
ncbi:MAG: tetratricopeptide repeat protein [Phycisphaerae bacterium]